MTPLVTVEQLMLHLRIDTDDDDAELALLVLAASKVVLNYLKAGQLLFLNPDGTPLVIDGTPVPVPDEVQWATLLMGGYLYRQRDEDADHEFETGFLPRPVTALLYPLRDPALA